MINEERNFNGRKRLSQSKSISIEGQEGKPVVKDQYVGRSLGVFTSGGDSQGMNAALRAIVRMGIYLGCKVYFIYEGYQGMVDGGTNIKLASWVSVTGIVGTGGTIIGSARCMEFKERAGRLKAAKNLVKFGINNLVCIGGDGTLTGANLFKQEWSELLDELHEKNEISDDERIKYNFLNIVGLVGSIDNDFCGTDMTIGADSALHRIIEAADAIVTTALSHQRCFVMEVMGRHCGYLALVAGLACDADWIMIPENPAEDGWENKLCERLSLQREAGHRLNIIIVAEGAIDKQGNSITSNYVKDTIVERLKFDTRVTVLGHVQRGGFASAFDRTLGTRMGSEAVLALMNVKPDSVPVVIAIKGNAICHIPLMESVKRTQLIAQAIKERTFDKVCELRGATFQRNLETYLQLSKIRPKIKTQELISYNLMIVNVGSPVSGVNSTVRSFVRHGIGKGCKIFGMKDGFEGVLNGSIKELEWMSVYGWNSIGGSLLGCQRSEAKDIGFENIANCFKQYKIHGLLIVGGFEAYKSVIQLQEARSKYPEFRIPIVCLPATISNNVPGTDFSIGADTALNEIVCNCDKIKQSAVGSKRRVFVVETMGGYCGYLATMAGMASGADQAYIFERPFSIRDLVEDVNYLCRKIKADQKCGFLLRNERANENYTTQFITSLLSEEGKEIFTARSNVMGHVQQGGIPSPFDRVLSIKLAAVSLNYILNLLKNPNADGKDYSYDDMTAVVIGLRRRNIVFNPVTELKGETDFKYRIPLDQWWLSLRPLLRIMAQHDTIYVSEIVEDVEGSNSHAEEDAMMQMWSH